jgi:hypothetical protein
LRYVMWSILNTFYLAHRTGGVKVEWREEGTKVVASVKTKNQRPPVKTKKMTKPKNKPTPKPRMVSFNLTSTGFSRFRFL